MPFLLIIIFLKIIDSIVGDKVEGLRAKMRKYELRNEKLIERNFKYTHENVYNALIYTHGIPRSAQIKFLGVDSWAEVQAIKEDAIKDIYYMRYSEGSCSNRYWDDLELNFDVEV